MCMDMMFLNNEESPAFTHSTISLYTFLKCPIILSYSRKAHSNVRL